MTSSPAAIAACILFAGFAAAQDTPPSDDLRQFEEDRTDAYGEQLDAYLRDWIVNQYPERAAQAWQRDYSSAEAFEASVAPNRERWRAILNPPALSPSGPAERRPHPPLADLKAEWVTVPLGPLAAEGLLVVPDADAPVPLVIAQHGIGSFPERTFGLMDDGDAYHSYARALVDAGFAVLAPMNLRSVERRNHIERLCRLADTTLPGIELTRIQRLLDEVLKNPRIDAERVGMWGVSLGGLATMFWMPLEPRIDVGVVCAWYNHRLTKMAVPDDNYVSFIVTEEEHAFFRGWCTEFTDSDAVSMICPRPVMVQHGKVDRIGWWPDVVKEFEAGKVHYEKLGMPERFVLDLHEGGHEASVEAGVDFLKKWLASE